MIIFEYSQKQEKTSEVRPSSGEHVYATVNRNKPGDEPTNRTTNDSDNLSELFINHGDQYFKKCSITRFS